MKSLDSHDNMTSSLDPTRLCLTILYLRQQDSFYKDYADGIRKVASYMWNGEELFLEKQTIPIAGYYPDICAFCCFIREPFPKVTWSGRVRHGCTYCQAAIPFSQQGIRYLWPAQLADILYVSETVLETYLAQALWYISKAIAISKTMTKERK